MLVVWDAGNGETSCPQHAVDDVRDGTTTFSQYPNRQYAGLPVDASDAIAVIAIGRNKSGDGGNGIAGIDWRARSCSRPWDHARTRSPDDGRPCR